MEGTNKIISNFITRIILKFREERRRMFISSSGNGLNHPKVMPENVQINYL